MPYKKTYYPKAKPKKVYKKAYKAKPKPNPGRNLSMVSLGQGFPKKLNATHRYHASFPMTSTAGSQSNYLFKCNAGGDPDYTGTGHQPMYWDQFAAIYDQYTIIGSQIKYMISNSASNGAGSQVTLFINDDTTTTASMAFDSLQEQPTAKTFQIVAGSSVQITKYLKWSSRKFFGKNVLSNPNFTASPSADPTELSYFQISMAGLGGASTTINVNVEITYIVIWSEVKDVAGS